MNIRVDKNYFNFQIIWGVKSIGEGMVVAVAVEAATAGCDGGGGSGWLWWNGGSRGGIGGSGGGGGGGGDSGGGGTVMVVRMYFLKLKTKFTKSFYLFILIMNIKLF